MSEETRGPAFSIVMLLLTLALAAVYAVAIQVPLLVIPVVAFVVGTIALAGFTAKSSRFGLVRLVFGVTMACVILAASWYAWFWVNFSADEARYVLSQGPLGMVQTLDDVADQFAYQVKDFEITSDFLRTIWLIEAAGFLLAGVAGVFWEVD